MGSNQPDIDAIRAREQAATPGPWVIATGKRGFGIGTTIFEGSEQGRVIMYSAEMGADMMQYAADCSFCAHARDDIPALLERVAELERLNTALHAELNRFKEKYLNIRHQQTGGK